MRIYITLISLITCGQACLAQNTPKLYPYFFNWKYGYKNQEHNLVIPCIYDRGEEYSGGFAVVGSHGRCGTIDSVGNIVIPFQYDDLYYYNEGPGIAVAKKDGKYIFTDKYGKRISKYSYDFWETFQWHYAPVCRNDRWGLVDTNGEEVIKCAYDKVFALNDGLAAVMQDEKWGYVDTSGHVVIRLKYDAASVFLNNAAVARHGNKEYLIDRNGKILTPKGYNSITVRDSFIIAKKDTLYGLLSTSGKELTQFEYRDCRGIHNGNIVAKMNGKYMLVTAGGQLASLNTYESYDPTYDFAIVKNNEKYGVIDRDWQHITPCIYNDVKFLTDHSFIVKQNGKWKLMDTSGKELSSIVYDDIATCGFPIEHQRLPYKVKMGNKTGMLDGHGREVIPCLYDNIYHTDDDSVFEVISGKKMGYIFASGEPLIPCEYDYTYRNTFDGAGFVTVDNKWLLTNRHMRILQTPYSWGGDFKVGMAEVRKNHKCGVVDTTGREIIPCIYDELRLSLYGSGQIWVRQNNKTGFIDTNGRAIIPCNYDYIGSRDNDYLIVNNNEKYGVINYQNKIVVPLQFDELVQKNEYSIFPAIVKSNNKFGIIDSTGNFILPCIYDTITSDEARKGNKYASLSPGGHLTSAFIYQEVQPLEEERSIVKRNGKYGYIDEHGKEVIRCIYQRAQEFKNGFALVKKDDHYLIINRKGKITNSSPLVWRCGTCAGD